MVMMNSTAQTTLALMSEKTGDRTAWVHLIPNGSFDGIDGRSFTLANAADVISRTRANVGKRQIVVDYEHQSIHAEKNGKPAPAAGWIVGMEARDDGIWAMVEWTDTAAAHIAKREYRYLSPVFSHTKEGVVTRVVNAALTNSPNLDQLTALARAEIKMDKHDSGKLEVNITAAAALLGLADNADQETVMNRLREVMAVANDIAELTGDTALAAHDARPDPARFVPIGDFERAVADANKLRQGVTQKAAEDHVAAHVRSGALAPYLKDWAVSLCTVNKPQFDAFIGRVGPAFNKLTAPLELGNALPKSKKDEALTEDELAICARMGVSAEQFNKAR